MFDTNKIHKKIYRIIWYVKDNINYKMRQKLKNSTMFSM